MLDQSQVRVVKYTLWLTREAQSDVLEGVSETMRDFVRESREVKSGPAISQMMVVEHAMENHDLQFSGKVNGGEYNLIPDQVWDNQVPEDVVQIAQDVLYYWVWE